MTTSRLVVLVRVLVTPLLVAGVGLVLSGALFVVTDLQARDDLYDGLGLAFGVLFIAGGVPLTALSVVVLRSRRPAASAGCGLVLSAMTITLFVLMNGDYAPWPGVAMALGLALGAGCVAVLTSGRDTVDAA